MRAKEADVPLAAEAATRLIVSAAKFIALNASSVRTAYFRCHVIACLPINFGFFGLLYNQVFRHNGFYLPTAARRGVYAAAHRVNHSDRHDQVAYLDGGHHFINIRFNIRSIILGANFNRFI